MARLLAFALTLLAALPAAAADPEFNGRKKSEWETMLREQQSARLRKVAVVALGQIVADHANDPVLAKEVLQAVGRALKSDSAPSVRAEAAGVCGNMAVKLLEGKSHDPAVVVLDLAENLRVEKEPAVRREVATALGRYGKLSKSAVPPLAAILSDKDAAVREAAATALGRIGPDAKASAPDLAPLVADPERAVRLAAVFALGRVGPEDTAKASAALAPLLADRSDPALRREAVASLGFLADPAPANVQAVAGGLQDPDVEVRRATAQALGKFAAAARVVERELEKAAAGDADKLVRGHALRSLCDGFAADPAKLIPFLTQRLENEAEFDVKLAVIEQLGDLGYDGRPALPALRNAQRDVQVRIREAANSAAKRIEKAQPKPKPAPTPEAKPAPPPAPKPVPPPVEEPEVPEPKKPV